MIDLKNNEHKTNPMVTIGLPVYNGQQYIREALSSLVAQTFKDLEIIISDNDSTDATGEICREYEKKDNRIRYIRQNYNIGPTANFKLVLDNAEGRYFLWMAADDVLDERFVELLVQKLEEYPSIVCMMSDVINIDESGRVLSTSELDRIRINDICATQSSLQYVFFTNPASNIFFCIYGIFRTEAIRKCELNFKNQVKYASGSEIPFLAQACLLGKIASLPIPLKKYRRHSQSVFHKEGIAQNFIKQISSKTNVSIVMISIIRSSNLELVQKSSLICVTLLVFIKFMIFSAKILFENFLRSVSAKR